MKKALLFLLGTALTFAQDEKPAEPEADSVLVPLSELRPLETKGVRKEKHSFQYGVSAANTYITDKAALSRGYWLGNYRPYIKYSLNEQHVFTGRLRTTYKHNPGVTDAQKKNGQVVSNWEYSLELLGAELNFDRHQITVGRNFYRIGRGLLLSNFADGAEYSGSFRYGQVKALGLYSGQYSGCMISVGGCATSGDISQKGPYDIVPGRAADAAVPDPGRRFFAGAQYESPQLYGARIQALALYSYDMSRDASTSTSANTRGKIFAFDPLYLGAGLSGYIVTPRLRYLSEFIYEMGNTYNKREKSGDTNQQTNIRAWGLTLDLNYSIPFFEELLKSGLTVQYATGSGRDVKNDQPNPGNPAQANESGNDTSFYYFGAYSAGLALKPKLANLHIYRAGFQFRPLHYFYWGRNLMLTFKYSWYNKVRADYGISDDNANRYSARVGYALDGQIIWDFRSDFKLFYQYGYFQPSAAYASVNATPIQVHLISLNLLF